MKVFLSYKFTGSNKEELRHMIESISKDLQTLGHETFCFFRDVQKWGSAETNRLQIISRALSYIDKSDVLLLIVTTTEKSIGMGVEAGYTKAMGKKILLAKKNGIEADYLESMSDKTVTFKEDFPNEGTLSFLFSI